MTKGPVRTGPFVMFCNSHPRSVRSRAAVSVYAD